ncbi:MAG: PspC domain-containing protein [Candidatus Rokubacteria bacterium]|nr:PspC domain-containing protein [Candidatus Rokubacteria bacterium]
MPLQRSRTNRKIAGVCGGIAEWLGWDPTAREASRGAPVG